MSQNSWPLPSLRPWRPLWSTPYGTVIKELENPAKRKTNFLHNAFSCTWILLFFLRFKNQCKSLTLFDEKHPFYDAEHTQLLPHVANICLNMANGFPYWFKFVTYKYCNLTKNTFSISIPRSKFKNCSERITFVIKKFLLSNS